MRNTFKEDIQKFQTEAGPHTDMASTQQHKKKFLKKEYMRDYMRRNIKCNTLQRNLKYVQRNTSIENLSVEIKMLIQQATKNKKNVMCTI